MSFLPRANTTSIPKHLIPQWDLFCLGIVKSYRALMHRLVTLHPNGTSNDWSTVTVTTREYDNEFITRLIYEEGDSFYILMEYKEERGIFSILAAEGSMPEEWRKIPLTWDGQREQSMAREQVYLEGKSDAFVVARRTKDGWSAERMSMGDPGYGLWRRLLAHTDGRYELKCNHCMTVIACGTRADMANRAKYGENIPCFYCESKGQGYNVRRDEDFVDFDIEEEA